MARTLRRSRGRNSTALVLFLAVVAILTFAGGVAVLHGRSEEGLILRARVGLPVDRVALTRTIGKIAHRTFSEFGVPLGAQVAKDRRGKQVDALDPPRSLYAGTTANASGRGEKREAGWVVDGKGSRGPARPPIVWTAYLPGRASTLQLNARMSENLRAKGAAVLDAWEDTLATAGSQVHLVLGAGNIATHEIRLERRTDAVGARGYESARLMLVVDAFASPGADTLGASFLNLDVPLTVAVLPQSKSTKAWGERLKRAGHEVLLQIPMEPLNYPQRDPGPGAVLVDMPSGQIQRLVKRHLSEVSPATGATSYMGAMALSDVAAMTAVMNELKRAEVYYLDARTIPGSIAAERAAQEGVTCFRVDQRLETPGKYETQVKMLGKQLEAAVDLARRRGYAIVLVHPDKPSLAVLRRDVPKLLRSGVRFERLSSLLKPQAL
ncbi:MAG: divergent polysaccharide deacetylase family protein [Candidatus Eiseniibacteriota bacterium]